jgi:hypothetical protein
MPNMLPTVITIKNTGPTSASIVSVTFHYASYFFNPFQFDMISEWSCAGEVRGVTPFGENKIVVTCFAAYPLAKDIERELRIMPDFMSNTVVSPVYVSVTSSTADPNTSNNTWGYTLSALSNKGTKKAVQKFALLFLFSPSTPIVITP